MFKNINSSELNILETNLNISERAGKKFRLYDPILYLFLNYDSYLDASYSQQLNEFPKTSNKNHYYNLEIIENNINKGLSWMFLKSIKFEKSNWYYIKYQVLKLVNHLLDEASKKIYFNSEIYSIYKDLFDEVQGVRYDSDEYVSTMEDNTLNLHETILGDSFKDNIITIYNIYNSLDDLPEYLKELWIEVFDSCYIDEYGFVTNEYRDNNLAYWCVLEINVIDNEFDENIIKEMISIFNVVEYISYNDYPNIIILRDEDLYQYLDLIYLLLCIAIKK